MENAISSTAGEAKSNALLRDERVINSNDLRDISREKVEKIQTNIIR